MTQKTNNTIEAKKIDQDKRKAISTLEYWNFEVDLSYNIVFGKEGIGTHGSGAALDHLLNKHEFKYAPEHALPRRRK